MAETIRAALVQSRWTGDRQSMIDAAVGLARAAAAHGASVLCFQELCSMPSFFGSEDPGHFAGAERVPGGPSFEVMRELARELSLVLVVPVFEQDQPGVHYNAAFVLDADGRYLGKYRKTHLCAAPGMYEKYYFRPGNLGYPAFETAVGRIGVYLGHDRHFPECWRALGLAGATVVFNPAAASQRLAGHLWRLEQPAAAVANEYFVGTVNRVGTEPSRDADFFGSSYFVDPRGKLVGEVAPSDKSALVVRDLDMDVLVAVREELAFYRDRNPAAYGALVAP